MKIVFVYMASENLGIGYLSSVLRKEGHNVELVFDHALFNDKHYITVKPLYNLFSQFRTIVNNIIAAKPDIIVFSVFTSTYQWALEISKEIKKKMTCFVLFGGVHTSSLPENVISNESVDAVCIGEGEEAIVELVNNFKDGRMVSTDILNMWFKDYSGKIIKNPLRPILEDLDTIPYPDKDIFIGKVDVRESYLIITSRGCPFSCTYCNMKITRDIYGYRKVRFRSPDNVIAELKLAKNKYKIKSVDFVDDVFTLNKMALAKLLPLYKKEIGLPFRCNSHPLCLDNKSVMLLKESGCYKVQIGVQSVNENTRRNILKRYETNEQISKTLNLCQKFGLNYQLDHIFGIPGENFQHYFEAADFYLKHKPVRISCFWLTYLPRTEIMDYSLSKNVLNIDRINEINNGMCENFHYSGSVNDLKLLKQGRGFELFFTLLPLIPRSISQVILKSGLIRYLSYLPKPFIVLFDFVSLFKHRDYSNWKYVKCFFRNLVSFKMSGVFFKN